MSIEVTPPPESRTLHALLMRQIRRHFGDGVPLPDGLHGFLESVEEAYVQYDADLATLGQSMGLLSKELTESNEELLRQVEEMTQIQSALRLSEARLEKAHQVARLGNWVWDVGSGEIVWSKEVYIIFGAHPVIFEPTLASFMEAVHPDDRAAVDAAIRQTLDSGAPYNVDHRILLHDESIRYLNAQGEIEYDDAGQPLRMFGTVQDITARKQVEQALKHEKEEQAILIGKLEDAQNQLLQSEKLASIGQLAAGVAHEINNPIGYVHSNLGALEGYIHDLVAIIRAYQAADMAMPRDTEQSRELERRVRELDLPYLLEDIPSLMKESKEGITRVRKIIQDLKDFSRLDTIADWQLADIRRGLESTLNIVSNEIKYKADVVLELSAIPEIECLPSNLNQVFLNLLVNAAHAIEDGQRGTITLRTGLRGRDHIFVECADTGKGIPDEIRHRIFDPFFTTKPVGKGTGLGLSLSYGIVQKHRGRIELESEVGKGTTFRIVLPVSQADAPST